MDTPLLPCGGLRAYLANQDLLASLSKHPLDVLIFDELGLTYRAALRLSACRRRLLVMDPETVPSEVYACPTEGGLAGATSVEHVTRGDGWLAIPLNTFTTVDLASQHSPHRMKISADGLHLVMERTPQTSMQPLVLILQRLCNATSYAPLPPRERIRDLRREPSVPAHGYTPPSLRAEREAQPHSTPHSPSRLGTREDATDMSVSTQTLYETLHAKLNEVRLVRQQLLNASLASSPASVEKLTSGTPPRPSPDKMAFTSCLTTSTSSASHSPLRTTIVAMRLPSARVATPPRLSTQERERLRWQERPHAPQSAGQSLGTIGSLGPASDDASAMRRYREIRGGSLSSITEPGLPYSSSETD